MGEGLFSPQSPLSRGCLSVDTSGVSPEATNTDQNSPREPGGLFTGVTAGGGPILTLLNKTQPRPAAHGCHSDYFCSLFTLYCVVFPSVCLLDL